MEKNTSVLDVLLRSDLPESAFLFVGTIDEAIEKAKRG